MRNIPYGYKIVDGQAVVDEAKAAAVRDFFDFYISGLALMAAAKKAGLSLYHGSAGRILRNEKYLGGGYYPAVISREIFDRAEEIRIRRAKALGRVKELEAKPAAVIPVRFKMEPVKKVSEDPFEQAAYAYGLIESVVETDGRE